MILYDYQLKSCSIYYTESVELFYHQTNDFALPMRGICDESLSF